MEIVKGLILMLVLGALIGVLLGIASKKFYVKEDTRVADVLGMLPGLNCGGCGNAGCQQMAEKLVKGESNISQCRPCKQDQKEKILAYLAEHKDA